MLIHLSVPALHVVIKVLPNFPLDH